MGAAADGGRGFKERARVSGEKPIGAARCRQQHNQASCQPPPPPDGGGGGHGGFPSSTAVHLEVPTGVLTQP